jgi:hypothetical protein
MTSYLWTRKGLVLSVAIVTLVAIGAVSLGLAYPEPVPSAALGPDWQCTRLAFVLTTCKKLDRGQAATSGVREHRDCPRRMILVQRNER